MVLISKLIGDFGKYQLCLCLIVFLSEFGVAFHHMAIYFLAQPIQFSCSSNKTCCENPSYDKSEFTRTIVTEWDLVCVNSWLKDLTQTLFQFGVMTGSLLFGMASDRYGRQPSLIFAVVLELFSGIISSFLPTYWSFTIVRMILGMSVGGIVVVGFVLVMEYTGGSYREIISALFHVPFTLGILLLALFGYFIRDYEHFQLSISMTNIVLLFYICILPESPRWLLVSNKTAKAVELMEKIAKINNLPAQDIDFQIQLYRMESLKSIKGKGSIFELYRSAILRKHILLMMLIWFACSYCFYGLFHLIANLIDNVYINVSVCGCVFLFACFFAIPLITNFNRKTLVIISNIIVTMCFLFLSFVLEKKDFVIISITISCFGMFSNFILFMVLYLYCTEIFPTTICNAALGIASMTAQIGAMIAPYIIGLPTYGKWYSIVAFVILPIVAAMLCVLLPETWHRKHMMTIEDSEVCYQRNMTTITN